MYSTYAGSAMFAIVGVQGYLQELLLQHTFQNRFSLFVTALQCGGLALMATVQLALAPDEKCVSYERVQWLGLPASVRSGD